ncbi:histidine triad nucleotide-binding protein [[Clostridium] cellulosi]
MDDCLFCKIVAGEIPSRTVYEDDLVKAFYDINPCAPVHFLVIPKTHIPSVNGINAENSAVVSHIFEVIARLAKEMKLDAGYRVVTNCGKAAGQTVQHLHFHVIAGRDLTLTMG